jgi:hypothetical protein
MRMRHHYLFAQIGVGVILTVGCLRNRDKKSGWGMMIRINVVFRN